MITGRCKAPSAWTDAKEVKVYGRKTAVVVLDYGFFPATLMTSARVSPASQGVESQVLSCATPSHGLSTVPSVMSHLGAEKGCWPFADCLPRLPLSLPLHSLMPLGQTSHPRGKRRGERGERACLIKGWRGRKFGLWKKGEAARPDLVCPGLDSGPGCK